MRQKALEYAILVKDAATCLCSRGIAMIMSVRQMNANSKVTWGYFLCSPCMSHLERTLYIHRYQGRILAKYNIHALQTFKGTQSFALQIWISDFRCCFVSKLQRFKG